MIVDLPGTTTSAINRKLVDLREGGGTIALGRVLTLVIVTGEREAELAIDAANSASHEHPCRVIVVVQGTKRGVDRLDAQIRVGGDAGASEVLVLRLYGAAGRSTATASCSRCCCPTPPSSSGGRASRRRRRPSDPIGRMGHRRITDARGQGSRARSSTRLAKVYQAGDSDLSWTRLTIWRGLLAAALDQPPYERVDHVTVSGASDSPSTDLLAGWLAESLRCPVLRTRTTAGTGMSSVRMERRSGNIDLVRADSPVATLLQPGQPERRIGLHRRSIAECLAEELRRLETDAIYEAALTRGLEALAAHPVQVPASAGHRRGRGALDRQGARRLASAERQAARASRRGQAGRAGRQSEEGDRPAKSAQKTVTTAATKTSTQGHDDEGQRRRRRTATKAGKKAAGQRTAARRDRRPERRRPPGRPAARRGRRGPAGHPAGRRPDAPGARPRSS